METAYVVVLSFFFIVAIHRLLNRGESKNMSKQPLPPGPRAIPVLGHLHLLEKPYHLAFMRLAARYGPVFSLQLGSRAAVVVSTADCARECLAEHDATFANRPTYPTLHLMTYGGATIGHSAYGAHWRHVRRVVSLHLLSPQRVLSSMVPTITAEVRAMARRMYRAAAGGAARIELKGRLLELSLSTLMETIAQTKTYRPADDADTDMSPETQEFKQLLDAIISLLGLTNVLEFLPVLQTFDVLGLKKKIAAAAGRRDAFFQRLIDAERRRLDDGVEGQKKSMLAVLLALQKSEPENYTDEKIMALCFRFEDGGGSAEGRLLIPFGMGRRKCPGETMALQIMGLALGTMIQCFDWGAVGGGGAPKVDMTQGGGLTLPRAVPLEAMCKPRQVMLDVLQKL
ncbi:cytochrome P450 family 81 subfamily D polypeptide 8 [Zea mays]|uniref:Cytochrome P450 family 81 subfamily D polypeptide 8 n=1 Tax=Zea mays TaxID=4577 RepID=A0A1D6L5H5_MAIZE|nr:cytochrome P450 family 81 subfamily D polypeptide 8 [Zea mays]